MKKQYEAGKIITPFREVMNMTKLIQGVEAIQRAARAGANQTKGDETGVRENTYYIGIEYIAEEVVKMLEIMKKESALDNKTDMISGMEDGLREIADEFTKYIERISK